MQVRSHWTRTSVFSDHASLLTSNGHGIFQLSFQFPDCKCYTINVFPKSLAHSLTHSLTHSTSPSQAQAQAQPLRSISLSRSGCQVQMPYHARHSLLCLALIFTRSADTPNPRQHRRQAAAPFREAAPACDQRRPFALPWPR